MADLPNNPPRFDVNEGFATERLRQIENASDRAAELDKMVDAGELTKLTDGRYRVNTGYDKGEYLSETGMPVHGLDVVDGKVQIYSAVDTWYGLGNIIPGGTTDIDKVLTLGGLDWHVTAEPLTYPWGEETKTVPGMFATARNDTGDPLGVIGSMYANGGIIQNRTAFEFLQDLAGRYDVPFESAGPLRGGRTTFVSMRLPDTVRIDVDGVNDEVVMFLVALNSFDGKSPFRVIVTPWRPVCRNTERFALRDAKVSWTVRHTARALTNMERARQSLALSLRYVEAWKDEEETLARTTMTVDEFLAVCSDDELWPLADDAKQTGKTRHGTRMEELAGLYQANAEKLGKTGYAAERAITEYLDHKVTVRPHESLKGPGAAVRATLAIEGANDAKKTRAHKLLLLTR